MNNAKPNLPQTVADVLRDLRDRHATGTVEIHVKDGEVRAIDRRERVVCDHERPIAK